MTKNAIAFEELRGLLIELGFSESSQEPNRARFEHPATGTILLFRAYNAKETVGDREMVVVRRQLVDNGLNKTPVCDRFMQKASA